MSTAFPVSVLVNEFEAVVQTYNKNFDVNKWFESLPEAIKNGLLNTGVAISTMIHTAWKEGKEYVEEFFTIFSFDKLLEWLIDSEGASFYIDSIISFTSAFNDRDEGKYTTSQAWTSFIINITISAVSIFVPMELAGRVGMNVVSFITNLLLDGLFNFQNGHLWGV